MILLIAGPALLALGLTALNLLTWPRAPRQLADRPTTRHSVLIPARNEERNIEACVRAALAALPADGELLVGEDHSDDATPQLLAALASGDRRLRIITPPPLPPGWVGKPHNCHHLARAARGDTLVFVDADVQLAPDALAQLDTIAQRYAAGVVTAFPAQQTQTPAEAHLMPLLALTYTAWLPLALVWASPDPRFLAANGQLLRVDRQTYQQLGGFEAVRDEVVDDMAFCRRAKELGHTVVFADGRDTASCRMYGSGAELWAGFTKNLYEGLGERPERLALAITLYAWAFVLPYAALLVGWLAAPQLLIGGAVGVGANLAARGLLAGSRGHRWSGLLTHPLAVLALIALALDSARRTVAGRVTWAGRTYTRRVDRRTT